MQNAPLKLWRLSNVLHERGMSRTARFVKAANFMVFKTMLPPEVRPGDNLTMMHSALGVGVHVQTKFGRDVMLFHNVSFAANVPLGSGSFQRIGNRVTVGTGAIIIGPIEIGDDAVVGAGSIVTKSVPPGAVVAGSPARVLSMEGREINARRLGRDPDAGVVTA